MNGQWLLAAASPALHSKSLLMLRFGLSIAIRFINSGFCTMQT